MAPSLLEVVFPQRCAGCSSSAGGPFCAACRLELVALVPPWCARCGHPSARPVEACPACPPDLISTARAAFAFEGPVRRAVHKLKFGGWRTVAPALGAAMTAVAGDLPADAVTWVPLSPRRRRERGYDQARALAREVARRRDLPLVPLLERVADTPPQARKGAAERREAMRGQFGVPALVGRSPLPERLLLVDDVLTTGATLAACAEALLTAGAREVSALVAARAITGRGAHPGGSSHG